MIDGPYAPFDAPLWLKALPAIGGGYALAADRRLCLMIAKCDPDDLTLVLAQIVGNADRQELLRQVIEQRQGGRELAMARVPALVRSSPATLRSWRRQPRRRWARAGVLTSIPSIFVAIPSLPRATLSEAVNRMLDRMDDLDGDADSEDLCDDDEDGHDSEDASE